MAATSTDPVELANRKVLIPGGTGAVGEGIVRAYLEAGATVIVPTRTEGKSERFRDVLGDLGQSERLHFVVGDYASFTAAEDLARKVDARFGALDDVVATIGGWWAGKAIWQIDEQDWQKAFVGLATAHVAVLRAFFPSLPRSGAYTLILGGSAFTPVPGSGIVSMEQAALLMMRQVLELEAQDQSRIFALVLGPVATRMRHMVDPDWVQAKQVGEVAAALSANPAVDSREIRLRSQSDIAGALRAITEASHG